MRTTILQMKLRGEAVVCRFTSEGGGYFRWRGIVDGFAEAIARQCRLEGRDYCLSPGVLPGSGAELKIPLDTFLGAFPWFRRLSVVKTARSEGGFKMMCGSKLKARLYPGEEVGRD